MTFKNNERPGVKITLHGKNSNPLTGEEAIKKNIETFYFVQKRLYLLTSVIGDTTRPFNKYKGLLGGFIWIMNLLIHFSLDFYEAKFLFHASWATSIGIFFLCFVSCTIYTIKHSVPWYIKTVKKLAGNELHTDTMKKLKFIYQGFPLLMPCLAAAGAGAQFGCYAYDGALRINFNTGPNSTHVPAAVETLVNVIRMTSLLHIFYAFWFYLVFHLILLFTIQSSMKEFNGKMRHALKEHPPSIPFPQAVDMFSYRTRLLDQGSKRTTMVLTIILVTTSVSFVVNAYNFLFVKRLAIYVWFALAPLVWTVSPLMAAAWVTWTHRKYKYVVIQAWVEIPEEYDEIWNRQDDAMKRRNPKKTSRDETKKITEKIPVTNIDSAGLRNRKTEPKPLKETVFTNVVEPDHEAREGTEGFICTDGKKLEQDMGTDNAVFQDGELSQTMSSDDPKIIESSNTSRRNQLPTLQERNTKNNLTISSYLSEGMKLRINEARKTVKTSQNNNGLHVLSIVDEEDNNNDDEDDLENKRPLSARVTSKEVEEATTKSSEKPTLILKKTFVESAPVNNHKQNGGCVLHRQISALSLEAPEKITKENLRSSKPLDLSTVVGVRQKLEHLKRRVIKKRKFNYEKYIKYLDCILITVGFSVGGVIVTWDRASFFCVVLFTLVGVFAQEAFLK